MKEDCCTESRPGCDPCSSDQPQSKSIYSCTANFDITSGYLLLLFRKFSNLGYYTSGNFVIYTGRLLLLAVRNPGVLRWTENMNLVAEPGGTTTPPIPKLVIGHDPEPVPCKLLPREKILCYCRVYLQMGIFQEVCSPKFCVHSLSSQSQPHSQSIEDP